MADQRTVEGTELRDRIAQYLRESGLAGGGARVVPLTGDASDRRYFRILPPDGLSVVLALHAGPIEFASLQHIDRYVPTLGFTHERVQTMGATGDQKPTDAPTDESGGKEIGPTFYSRPLLSRDRKTFWLLDRSV